MTQSEPSEFEVIVVGLGAMGSATAYQLARRGRRVLGLDAHEPGHTLGSSHGETRIIRMAYSEHPDYVPLLRRAYELWAETAEAARTTLLVRTGGLFIGPPSSETVAGALLSARTHGLPHTLLNADEVSRQFPVFRPRGDEAALYEDDAGVLFPERCIESHLRLAEQHGAVLRHSEAVAAWASADGEIQVRTPRRDYRAGKLVLTAGAWLGTQLQALRLPLQPERIPIFWFQPRAEASSFDLGRLPIWIWDDVPHACYGTPHVEWPGVKVARHHSGQQADPDRVDRRVTAEDEQRVRGFLQQRIPDLAGNVAASRVCLYTNTPDYHFVVDHHPRFANVVFAGGFSGHGFKFSSVIGEILAEMTLSGSMRQEARFLRADRFSGRETTVGASR